MVKKVIRENPYFFVSYLFFFVLGITLVLYIDKGQAAYYLNSHHNVVFDQFFKYTTLLGTGFLFIPLCIFLFLTRRKYTAFLMVVSYGISGPLIQLIKRKIISNNDRPALYFYQEHLEGLPLHEVDGVDLHKVYAFPSGHTNLAFLMMVLLAITSSNKQLGLIYFIVALMVAVSRMYLYQHFLIDTLGGSFIAILISLLVYVFAEKWGLKEKKFLN